MSSLSSGEETPEKKGSKCFTAVGVDAAIWGRVTLSHPLLPRDGTVKKRRAGTVQRALAAGHGPEEQSSPSGLRVAAGGPAALEELWGSVAVRSFALVDGLMS